MHHALADADVPWQCHDLLCLGLEGGMGGGMLAGRREAGPIGPGMPCAVASWQQRHKAPYSRHLCFRRSEIVSLS